MNKEQTEDYIKVMQHWVDGGTVQILRTDGSHDVWEDWDNPNWSWGHMDYRIKPEPKKVFMVVNEGYGNKFYTDRIYAEERMLMFGGTIIEFEEVMEDE